MPGSFLCLLFLPVPLQATQLDFPAQRRSALLSQPLVTMSSHSVLWDRHQSHPQHRSHLYSRLRRLHPQHRSEFPPPRRSPLLRLLVLVLLLPLLLLALVQLLGLVLSCSLLETSWGLSRKRMQSIGLIVKNNRTEIRTLNQNQPQNQRLIHVLLVQILSGLRRGLSLALILLMESVLILMSLYGLLNLRLSYVILVLIGAVKVMESEK